MPAGAGGPARRAAGSRRGRGWHWCPPCPPPALLAQLFQGVKRRREACGPTGRSAGDSGQGSCKQHPSLFSQSLLLTLQCSKAASGLGGFGGRILPPAFCLALGRVIVSVLKSERYVSLHGSVSYLADALTGFFMSVGQASHFFGSLLLWSWLSCCVQFLSAKRCVIRMAKSSRSQTAVKGSVLPATQRRFPRAGCCQPGISQLGSASGAAASCWYLGTGQV